MLPTSLPLDDDLVDIAGNGLPPGGDPATVHVASFERLVQPGVAPDQRMEVGLHAVFRAVFPVKTPDELYSLEYVSYELEPPRFGPEECVARMLPWASPIKLTIRLIVWERSPEEGYASIRDIKEQEVYFGEVPLVGPRGTLIVDGAERALPVKIRPAPGLEFQRDEGGRPIARMYDEWGNALRFELAGRRALRITCEPDPDCPAGLAFVPVRRARTLWITDQDTLVDLDERPADMAAARRDLVGPDGAVLVEEKQKLSAPVLARLRAAGVTRLPLSDRDLLPLRLAEDVRDADGKVLVAKYRTVRESLPVLQANDVPSVRAYSRDEPPDAPEPGTFTDDDGLRAWYAASLAGFSIGAWGRARTDYALGRDERIDHWGLLSRDVYDVWDRLVAITRGEASVDDRPLGRKRVVWGAGDQLAIAALAGLWQVAEKARDHLIQSKNPDWLMPHDLLDAKPFARAIARATQAAR